MTRFILINLDVYLPKLLQSQVIFEFKSVSFVFVMDRVGISDFEKPMLMWIILTMGPARFLEGHQSEFIIY